jgi:MFS superfamily sulfate permease-like transporter
MARRVQTGLALAALAWGLLSLAAPHWRPARALAAPAAFLLAGFLAGLGALALLHGGPLPGFLALKSLLTGLAVPATLALGTRARRPAGLLLVALLLAVAALTATRYAPQIPAAGLKPAWAP